MDGKTLARIGAIVFLAVAITATVIEMNRKDDRPEAFAVQNRPVASQDPLAAELLRCSEIDEAGPRDPSCLRAWTENRRRFLGHSDSSSSSAPASPTTLFPGAPADLLRKESTPAAPTGPATQAEPARPEVR